MTITNFPNGASSFGVVLPSNGFLPMGGNSYFLDPTRGSDSNDGLSPTTAKASLTAAYGLTTDNNNDIIYFLGGASANVLSAAFTWAKNYTHLVGLAAQTMVAQRCRITQSSGLTGASPLFTISGNGCIFRDIYIFQGVADATSLINVSVTGQRNYFYNVHFAGGGNDTQAVSGGASLHINGGSENTFDSCTIGVDTASAGNNMAALLFAATGGAARNIWRGCHFTLQASNAGAIWVSALGNSGVDRYQMFDNCWFTNLSSTSMTQGFSIAAGFDPANKRFLMKQCVRIGAGKWDNGDTGLVYGDMNAVTGADASGLMVQMIT